MGHGEYEPLESLSLAKSNALVSAKYQSSLVENQIMAVALTRIEAKAGPDGNATLKARLYPGELKRLVSDSKNIYRVLKRVTNVITGHTLFIEDGKGNFRAHAIVTDASYEDGVFEVTFNENLREHVLGLERNYTTYELSVLAGFRMNASFRLYEVLKSHAYKIGRDGRGYVDVVFGLSELRFMVGLANGDAPEIKRAAAAMGRDVDWDALYARLDQKDRKYERWADLQKYVIRPAQRELEEKSNIRFEYEPVRGGRRVAAIRFRLYRNEPGNKAAIEEKAGVIEEYASSRQLEMPRDLFPGLYGAYDGHNGLAKEDIDLLMREASQDASLVEAAIRAADARPHINNYMGWIISYIRNPEGYSATEVIEGSAGKAAAAREAAAAYEKDRPAVAARFWEKAKSKPGFDEFEGALMDEGIALRQLEEVCGPLECADIYIAWKKTGVIDL